MKDKTAAKLSKLVLSTVRYSVKATRDAGWPLDTTREIIEEDASSRLYLRMFPSLLDQLVANLSAKLKAAKHLRSATAAVLRQEDAVEKARKRRGRKRR